MLKADSINYFAALFIYKLTLPVISRLHPIDCLGGGVEVVLMLGTDSQQSPASAGRVAEPPT